jgi:hypothetical protein
LVLPLGGAKAHGEVIETQLGVHRVRVCTGGPTVPDDYSFLTANYVDLAEADGDYAALRRLYDDLAAPHEFDAVTIGRKASGEARFHLGHEDGRGVGGVDSTSWSLAAGLAAALFPSVGADAPAFLSNQRAILGAVAGEVGWALGRNDLMALGSHLDESRAGLVVVTRAEHETHIRGALCHARIVRTRSAALDLDRVRRVAAAADVVRR